MLRRFNYTGRTRIHREDVQISLNETDNALTFDVDLEGLRNYKLPVQSSIYLEAYRQTNWMRFEFGSVGAPIPPKDRRLTQFDSPEGIKFRLKVISADGTHKIHAEADAIPLITSNKEAATRKSLLPVKPQDLGSEIYRLDFDGGSPLLLINKVIGSYNDVCLSPPFIALVYPTILREVLLRILVIEGFNDETLPESWHADWLKLACKLPGIGAPPEQSDDQDSKLDWINKAVASYAKSISSLDKFQLFWEEEK